MKNCKYRLYNDATKDMLYMHDAPSLSQFFLVVDVCKETGIAVHVEQFVGFKDKNGKDIYENDIVEGLLIYPEKPDGTLPTKGIVTYSDNYGAFGIKNDAGNTFFEHHLINSLEITGNIHY